MSDNIPNEVMMEILGRLPVKTLLQIRCVCKSWCSLISSDNFVTYWNNMNNTHLLLLKHYTERCRREHFSLRLDDESLTEYPWNLGSLPGTKCYPFFAMVGSCNGLVCVRDDLMSLYDSDLYLWNPSIRKFVAIPGSRICCTRGSALGFGFDSATNDYKVVRIVYISGGTEVEIFSLKQGGWRSISVSDPVPYIHWEPSHACLHGSIHWVTGRFRVFIVLFDLGTEVFSRMELPTTLGHIRQAYSLSLAVFQDSLCVFQSDTSERKASIWVMKEYGIVESWTCLFNLDYSRRFDLREHRVRESWTNFHRGFAQEVRVIGLRRNGEVLLVKDEEMISVDIKAQTFKYLGIRGHPNAFSVNTYRASLALIDKANGLQEQ